MLDLEPVNERLTSYHQKRLVDKSCVQQNDQRSNASPTCVTGVIHKMQIFVRYNGTGETYILNVPQDITVERFIETAFSRIGLDAPTPASLTLRGKEIKASGSNLLQAHGVRASDTLTLTNGKLLGGSQVPLLSKEEQKPEESSAEYDSETATEQSARSKVSDYVSPHAGLTQEAWRQMTTKELKELVKQKDEATNLQMLQNCESKQIDELNQELGSSSSREMLDAAQLTLFLGTQIEKDEAPKSLNDLDDVPRELDLTSTVVEQSFEIMRSSNSDDQQLIVLTQFMAPVPCYSLQDDATWSTPMQRTHQLKLYDLDKPEDDGEGDAFWVLKTAVNLNLTGKIQNWLRLVRNSRTSDVAFLTSDLTHKKLDLNIIPNGQLTVQTISIPESSELHQLIMGKKDSDHKLLSNITQFIMDRDNLLMILYETQMAGNKYVNFYDITTKTTIVRVQDQMKLLYMHPIKVNNLTDAAKGSLLLTPRMTDRDQSEEVTDDFCIFNNCSFRIDFSDARQQIAKIQKPVEISKKTSNEMNNYEVPLNVDTEIVDWYNEDENTRGFAVCSDGNIDFYAAWKTSAHIPSKPDYTKKTDQNQNPLMIQIAVHSWETRTHSINATRRLMETENDQIETCQHLLLIRKIGQSTIFACNVSTKQICGLTFPGQILTFGIVRWDNDPAKKQRMMNVLLDDRAIKQDNNMHMVYVKFGTTEDLMENIYVSQIEVPNSWNKDLSEMTKALPSDLKEPYILCNADPQLKWLLVRTESRMKRFSEDVETYYSDESRFKIRDTNWMNFGAQVIFIIHDIMIKKDLVVTVDRNVSSSERVLHTLPQGSSIQCYLVEGIVYIVDSASNLIRLFLSMKTDGKLFVKSSDSRSLQSVEEIQSLAQLPPSQSVHMTDQTIIFDDKIIQISKVTGRTMPKNMLGAQITLVPGMLLSHHKDTHAKKEKLVMRSNPDSRRLPIGDEAFRQHLSQIHQVSENLLLIERKQDTWQQWALVRTDGTRCNMSIELKKALKEKCYVQSFTDLCSRCNLILTETNGLGVIQKAKILELTRSGDIASERELKYKMAEKSSLIAEEKILSNYRGEMLMVRVYAKSGTTSEPVYTQNDMKLISFKNMDKATEIAYTGNFFCWTGDKKVHLLDLSTNKQKHICLDQFSHFAGAWSPELYEINASDPKSLLEAGWLKKPTVDMKDLVELGDHLQVTIGKDARIYNLIPEMPVAVSEMNDMDELFDPCSFIETGFKLVSCSETADYGYLKKCLTVSPLQNLLIETRDGSDFSIYRRFSTTDIVDTQDFQQSPTHEISIGTIWADFFDLTLLQMIKTDTTPLTRILDRFTSEVAKNITEDKVEDMAGRRMRLELRRVNFWLQKKFVNYQTETGKLRTSSLLTEKIQNPSYRDILLKIGELSPEFSLISAFNNQKTMQDLEENMSQQVIESLSNSFIQTGSMKSICMLEWPTDLKDYFLYMSDTLEISHKRLAELLQEGRTCKFNSRPVDVELLNLRWFFAKNQNFIAFSMILTKMPTSFYSSKFTLLMLDHFWNDAQVQMINRQAIPYLFFCMLTVYYFHRALHPDTVDERLTSDVWSNDRIADKVIGIVITPLLAYSIWIEVMQIKNLKNKCDYFKEAFNWIDMTGISLTIIILAVTLSEQDWMISFEHLRVMASIATCFLIFKLFDWLRLFEGTSFYILLVENTLNDIVWFLVVFLLSLITFGLPMHMLDLNRSENPLILVRFDFWVLDAIYNQYLLSLGEFKSLDSVGEKESYDSLALLFFNLATFFTMVTMLNMLIAIMGDSFAHATENQATYAIMTKLTILGKQAPSLPQKDTQIQKDVFMIIIKPKDELDDDEGWQGTINKVTTLVKKSIHTMKQEMKMTMNKQQSEIVTAINISSVDVAGIKSEVAEIKSEMMETDNKVDEIKKMMEQLLGKKKRTSIGFGFALGPTPEPAVTDLADDSMFGV